MLLSALLCFLFAWGGEWSSESDVKLHWLDMRHLAMRAVSVCGAEAMIFRMYLGFYSIAINGGLFPQDNLFTYHKEIDIWLHAVF